MNRQVDINEKMRGILVDWIIEVHLKFKLLPETLYLTVNLTDRYLEKTQISRTRLQLVSVAALLIASKYEEIYVPELQDFVFITDNAYTKEEILAMERSILVTLQFNVTVPSSYRFLQRFCKIIKAQDKLFHLAQYIVELTLIEQRMLVFKPSQIAASALWLALKILYHESGRWSTELVHHSSYNEHHLRPCVKDMCILFTGIERCSLQMVRKKFALARYNKVALIRITPF
jgi:G2/mitotic-specific cyclin-B, other